MKFVSLPLVDFWSRLIIVEGEFADFTEVDDIYNCIMAIVCVVSAGLAAGLTMGMLPTLFVFFSTLQSLVTC